LSKIEIVTREAPLDGALRRSKEIEC